MITPSILNVSILYGRCGHAIGFMFQIGGTSTAAACKALKLGYSPL